MEDSSLPQDITAFLHPIDRNERDACALICAVRKGGQPTHGNVKRTIEALSRMGHRSGFIDGEGDGVGILTDIPRQLWMKKLAASRLPSALATNPDFWVAHLMIPAEQRPQAVEIKSRIVQVLSEAGLEVLIARQADVRSYELGPHAARNEPDFWQIAGIRGAVMAENLESYLFNMQVRLESDFGVHFPSFSTHSAVYKVQGTAEILRRYYPELRDPTFASTVTLGHARYSTNTNPIFERVQPFCLIGHNGEFNTISRFRMESAMLGIELDPGNSDSQDVDRALHTLVHNFGLDLIEAMELVFPPHDHDLVQHVDSIQQMYAQMRRSFGPFAQGPAALVARFGDQCVFSVDALGLRPLWFGETEKEYFASSERGVYPLTMMSGNPKPLGPGEKIALKITPGRAVEVLDYPAIQYHVWQRFEERGWYHAQDRDDFSPKPAFHQPVSHSQYPRVPQNGGGRASLSELAQVAVAAAPVAVPVVYPFPESLPWQDRPAILNTSTMAALGWERYHISIVQTMAETAKEQIGSLGWDGPLAALSQTRVNLADYFKETVAVVTNPAIDREREQAQFSTRTLLGNRPAVGRYEDEGRFIDLASPLLIGGHPDLILPEETIEALRGRGIWTLEAVADYFGANCVILPACAAVGESLPAALERLQGEAVDAVLNGAACLILDDTGVYSGESMWLDPLLITAAVDLALREYRADGMNLRRQTGIVLRSGGLRDMHDLALSVALGANAVLPYAMYAVGLGIAPREGKNGASQEDVSVTFEKMLRVMRAGLEKIISTIGCHELRGYGHSFSSVGLASEVAAYFSTANYFGSTGRGLTWADLEQEAAARAAEFRGEQASRPGNPSRLYPKVWKKIEALAAGTLTYEEYTATLVEIEQEMPVALRHILGVKPAQGAVDPAAVDTTIAGHALPVVIGAMSFGSQGELAYKAYGEAAARLNIVCVNGEGGELPEMMGRYPNNRGNQVASARFGVNIAFLNSCNLLEIKIGQGAKPGEGGQLPGHKVTPQVAEARRTTPGIDLISPNNNHDLYSIEDLAQLIDELKTANPYAKVSVKIPVVPGVGIIAVGIAKAGADIINLTGYDGGTGAARAHALRHVGLPAEIGLWLAHHALSDSGLRHKVELWCDGGMKSGRDVIKMLCLGANRVGFGTLAMVAVGCTICRKCHEGTCHVGITTHMTTKEEAASKGIKHFEPRDFEAAVSGICAVFDGLGAEIRDLTAALGVERTQDLVGRADLLEQIALQDHIDLSALTLPAAKNARPHLQPGVGRRLTRPRNTLSKQLTSVIAASVAQGDYELTYDDEQVMSMDRALGTHLAGALARREFPNSDLIDAVHLVFSNSAVPGNGLAAFNDSPLNVLVEGGAQDGVGKCARGGAVTILKGLTHDGEWVDGSVGKSFAYGAQGGVFIVQGDADTRACIRLSGADVIFGGEVREPLRDELGGLVARANLKGYACEYMTSGRVLIMGDPGPWMCAGMSGGVVYQRIQPEMKLTQDAIQRRLAPSRMVEIMPLDEAGASDVNDLLRIYIHTLEANNQADAAQHLYRLMDRPEAHFIKIAPPVH
ncbi:MAG: alpha-hydroxy-acid oxidizing protein [Anaerolineaceae bacterium]|nr:alpha-hydroxy-acid oxidizing protein [Anaerolineaceae bacterium]